jgi:hypothetical protein
MRPFRHLLWQRGWEQRLPDSLDEFKRKRKEEIDRVCSRYYAEFLGCVPPLPFNRPLEGPFSERGVCAGPSRSC